MKKRPWILALVLCFALGTRVWPGEDLDDFGPFRNDEKVQTLEMKNLDLLESSQMGPVQTQKWGIKDDAKAPAWTVQNDSADPKSSSTLFQLARPKKKKPLKFKLPDKDLGGITTADLNGDGQPDYVLALRDPAPPKPQGGEDGEGEEGLEGLPSDHAAFVVVLSGKKNYSAFLVENAAFNPEAVYPLGDPPVTGILATADFREEKSSLPQEILGNQVVFHLYQLLSVRKNQLAVENGLEKRFPKFVAQDLGAAHKNHKETKLLTDARKKELLGLHQPKITELHFIK